jgi:hypothetical protein
VLDAINPPEVLVRNGEAAVLKLKDGFALIVLQTSRTNVHHSIWFSEIPTFPPNSNKLWDGDSNDRQAFSIHGAKIWIGYGDAAGTWVQLDFGDVETGLALVKSADPVKIDLSNQVFKTAKPIKATDLQKSVGIK